MHSFSISEALRFGWNTFKRTPWIFVGSVALMIVISVVLNKIGGEPGLVSFIVGIVATVLQWWLYIGLTRIALRAYSGAPIAFPMLFGESWKTLLRYAIAAIVAGVITCIGLILLIVPGIIAMTALSLFTFLILEREIKPIDALKESRRLTTGHRMNIFFLILIIGVINIIGAIPMGLGLLVTAPISLLALVHMYKQIERGVAPAPIASSAPAPTAPSNL